VAGAAWIPENTVVFYCNEAAPNPFVMRTILVFILSISIQAADAQNAKPKESVDTILLKDVQFGKVLGFHTNTGITIFIDYKAYIKALSAFRSKFNKRSKSGIENIDRTNLRRLRYWILCLKL